MVVSGVSCTSIYILSQGILSPLFPGRDEFSPPSDARFKAGKRMETYPTHSGLKRCAKCGFEESVQSLECRRCGVIFSKLGHIRESSEPDSTPLDAYLSSAEEFQAETDFHTDAHVDTYTLPIRTATAS